MSEAPLQRRISALVALALALCAVEAAWVLIGLVHIWSHPVIGWLPVIALAPLTFIADLRTSRCAALPAPVRRFWRHLSFSAAAMTAVVLSNTHDAVGGPVPSQQFGLATLGFLTVIMAIVLWALLRLPAWQRSRGDWARFGLDTGVLVVTCGGLLWHFSLRLTEVWQGRGGPMLGLCVLTLISVIVTAKVSFAGTGGLDRRSLQILAATVFTASAAGALAPLLVNRPYLTTSMIAVPVASLGTILAAERQRRAATEPSAAHPAGRRFSVLPYLAVAAMTTTLLFAEMHGDREQLILAICVATLTGLVVIRQVSALRDNARLLDTVDANLRQLHAYQSELAHEVSHDPLTGIANRSAFTERLAALLATGEPGHVVLLDLDDFKVINDRLGHGTGDALLRAVTHRLHQQDLRPQDIVARIGGDEFTLLLPDLGDERVAALLRDLAETVQRPLSLHGHDLTPRVSIGVTRAQEGDDPEEILRRADVAMYAAKNVGGGNTMWFDPIMDRIADADARLATDLRQAITRDELFLLYQPIVELPHGRLAGVEALIRWRHPEHGLVSPAAFIPLAERNGYIVELGRWVLRQAVRQAAEWEQEFGPHAPEKVSVNISARQLREPGFPAEVAELLRTSGLDPHRLVAEVTETAVLGTGDGLAAVRELHALGLRVALDDFGTGQSSLSLLVDCPVKVLKVDKSFVDGVTGTSAQAVIVDHLIGITDGLEIEAVAEGVETPEQAAKLHAMGYRFGQGFHFAKPMPGEDIAMLLGVPAVPAPEKVDNFH